MEVEEQLTEEGLCESPNANLQLYDVSPELSLTSKANIMQRRNTLTSHKLSLYSLTKGGFQISPTLIDSARRKSSSMQIRHRRLGSEDLVFKLEKLKNDSEQFESLLIRHQQLSLRGTERLNKRKINLEKIEAIRLKELKNSDKNAS